MAFGLDKNQRRQDDSSESGLSVYLEVRRVAPRSPPGELIAQTDNAPFKRCYCEATMDLGLKCLRIAYNGNRIVSGGLYHLRPAEILEMRQKIEF